MIAALAGDLPALLELIGSASVALSENLRRLGAPAAGHHEVAVMSGPQAVEMAAPAWRSLEAMEGVATAFQSLSVAKVMAQAHHGRGEVPRIVVVRRAGRPVVVLPTVVTRWAGVRTIRFLGDPLIQYGDAIAAPDASIEHLDAAWRAAADPAVAPFAFLRKVRGDARIAPVLALRMATVATHEAPDVDTSQQYRAAREMRRHQRRLQERGEVAFEIMAGGRALDAAGEAIALKRTWLAERGLSSGVIGDTEWEAAIATLADAATSPLRVARLSVDGQTAAVEIGFVHDDRWCAFLGAMAPEFAKCGPGHVQMAKTIAHCHEQGLARYDLLAPADSYKSRIAHGSTMVCDHAAALSPLGWPALAAARAIPAAKRLAARMPASLKRTIGRPRA